MPAWRRAKIRLPCYTSQTPSMVARHVDQETLGLVLVARCARIRIDADLSDLVLQIRLPNTVDISLSTIYICRKRLSPCFIYKSTTIQPSDYNSTPYNTHPRQDTTMQEMATPPKPHTKRQSHTRLTEESRRHLQ